MCWLSFCCYAHASDTQSCSRLVGNCAVMWMYHKAIISDYKVPNLFEDYVH